MNYLGAMSDCLNQEIDSMSLTHTYEALNKNPGTHTYEALNIKTLEQLQAR